MKNPFKDFLYFSRGERRGILVLIIGIILIFLSGYIYSFRQNSRQLSEEESRIQTAALKEYDNFISSVREQEKNENSRFKKSEKYKKKIRLSVRIHKHREADFDLFLQGIAN